MKQLLVEHRDMLTWNHEDMEGIDSTIIEHRLCVDFKAKKIRWKQKEFSVKK